MTNPPEFVGKTGIEPDIVEWVGLREEEEQYDPNHQKWKWARPNYFSLGFELEDSIGQV